MNFINISKIFLKFISFVLISVVSTILLIIVSEKTSFSRINLLPLGGPSWALWTYPIYLLFGLSFSHFIFGLPKRYFTFLLTIWAIIFIVYYIVFNGSVFENPIPFGISAY
ncbi:hypothetical protein A2752_05480 [Candidatus Uhrbacteria bacterium RIFCSPHIGHO2_01_FULL_46_23]|nr:MAG: hypothetical protein A2752_05480 [Candidatus Uhrbacteria bacterium RIFCSPHIGHO2_01_FULL_46_23]